ncbi:MAG: UDP-2,3-diacylglucosamine diphosphatase LpxI [Kiritimatiellia bacterium]
MSNDLVIIAGKGAYPIELARSARSQGVKRVVAVAFRGETRKEIEQVADEVRWVYVGQLEPFRQAFREYGISRAVMAGQITPSNLFNARLDKPMRDLLKSLPRKNADTIFGAVGDELAALDVTLLPACQFMEANLVRAGTLTGTKPTAEQESDIRQGLELAKCCSKLQAGQSVAVKQGTVIAVEGFEGTDGMIARAGKIGGEGCVIVKVAGVDHDMRWDIPVVGLNTIKHLRKAKCGCLAMEADNVILLEKAEVIAAAESAGICLVALESEA